MSYAATMAILLLSFSLTYHIFTNISCAKNNGGERKGIVLARMLKLLFSGSSVLCVAGVLLLCVLAKPPAWSRVNSGEPPTWPYKPTHTDGTPTPFIGCALGSNQRASAPLSLAQSYTWPVDLTRPRRWQGPAPGRIVG